MPPSSMGLTILILVLVPSIVSCRAHRPNSQVRESLPGEVGPAFDESAAAGSSNSQYAQRCAAEMGLNIADLSDMSCLSGTEVPIKFDNRVVDSSNYREFVAGGRKCDNPHWLTSSCYTYDFMQARDIGNVQVVLNCRQKYFPDQSDPRLNAGMNKFERFKAYADAVQAGNPDDVAKYKRFAFLFDDMGVILRNKESGKVCYFTTYGSDFFGGFVPSPLRSVAPSDTAFKATLTESLAAGLAATTSVSTENKRVIEALVDDPGLNDRQNRKTANSFYFAPSTTGGCATCHSYGGFKYSPFTRAAAILPSIGSLSETPFLPVGGEIASALRNAGTIEVRVADDDTCTSCHRLSSQGSKTSRTCNNFAAATGNVGAALESVHTDRANSFPAKAWMPLNHRNQSSAQYTAEYGAEIEKARCCCSHPTAKGCEYKRYGPTAAEVDAVWRKGKAPDRISNDFGIGDDSAMDCSAPTR